MENILLGVAAAFLFAATLVVLAIAASIGFDTYRSYKYGLRVK